MKTGSAGLALIKEFEGCRLTAYRDAVGVWTIGYGHTAAAGSPAPKAGMTLTQEQADDLLVADLAIYEKAVSSGLTQAPNQNQFDAMVSLCFNIGPGNFGKSSVRRFFNAGETAKAANAFLMWNKAAGKVLKGLTRRRAAEMALFNKPAPSAVQTAPEPIPAHPPAVVAPDTKSSPVGFWAWLWRFLKA